MASAFWPICCTMPLQSEQLASHGIHRITTAITKCSAVLAYLRMVRLSNSLAASALVFVGARLVLPESQRALAIFPQSVWQAAVAMWFVTAFGYVSNDLFDRKEDAINKPGRPLPRGTISPSATGWFVAILVLGALLCSSVMGIAEGAAALLSMLLLTLYNTHLKSTPGGGNLLIGALAGCTLFVGGVAARGISLALFRQVLLPATMIAAFVTTREVLKTVEDVAGDRAVGKETVATRFGNRAAIHVVTALALATALLSLLTGSAQSYSSTYWAWISAGVILPLLSSAWSLESRASSQVVTHCLTLLKAGYIAGVLALWFA